MSTTDILSIGSTIRHRGTYDANTTYYVNNQVTMCNCVFQALGNNFSGIPPVEEDSEGTAKLVNTSTWKCIINNITLYNAALSPNDLDNRISTIETKIAEINDNADELDKKIDAQSAKWQSADDSLQSNIDAEADNREKADETLQGNINTEINDREAADTALQANIDALIGTIKVSEVDAWPASRAEAIAQTLDAKHSRWTLVDASGRNVGVLEVFSDASKCQLTEVLTSHYVANTKGVLDFKSHKDGEITQYFRCYNIASSTLPNEQGTWGNWTEYIAATVSTMLSGLDTFTDKLQTAIDTEVTDRTEAVSAVQTNLDALAAQKGAANGLAPLGADGKVPAENINETQEVVTFDKTVSGVTAKDNSALNVDGVVYDNVAKRFYAYQGSGGVTTYYNAWTGQAAYQNIVTAVPHSSRIFVDMKAGVPYVWSDKAGDLVQIAAKNTLQMVTLTQDEYDALVAEGGVDDETCYNIIDDEEEEDA